MTASDEFYIEDLIDDLIDDEAGEKFDEAAQAEPDIEHFESVGYSDTDSRMEMIREIEEKTGHKLSEGDPALAFLEITRIAGERFSATITENMSKIIKAEQAERELLLKEASDLKSEINALKAEIQLLTKEDENEPGVLQSLRTTAAYVYSEIKRISR